jgi:tetratricopeptide (TPR) repeat protein
MDQINNIRQLIKHEDYKKALILCEELTLKIDSDGSKSFLILSTLASCSIQLKEPPKKAITALEKAILLPESPQSGPPYQKLYKTLCDLYEQNLQWSKHANTLLKLYIIAKEKGNIDRLIILSESIIDSYYKAKEFDIGGNFLVSHLLNLEINNNENHSIKMLILLDQFQLSFINSQEQIALKFSKAQKSSLGVASGKLEKEKEIEALQKIIDCPWLLNDNIYNYIINLLNNINFNKEGNIDSIVNLSTDNIIVILSNLNRYLLNKRKRLCNQNIIVKEPNLEDKWIEINIISIKLTNLFYYCEDFLSYDIFFCLIESWLYCSSSLYSDISICVDKVLEKDCNHLLANAAKLCSFIERGYISSARVLSSKYLSQWLLLNKKTSSNSSPIVNYDELSINNITNSIFLFTTVLSGSFNNFVGFTVNEYLSCTQLAIIKIKAINDQFKIKFRSDIQELLLLGRVLTLSNVSQHSFATNECLISLPHIFHKKKRNTTIASFNFTSSSSIVHKDDIALQVDSDSIISRSMPFQWLVIKVLNCLHHYKLAIEISNKFLSLNPIISSWIIYEKTNSELHQYLSNYMDNIARLGQCLPSNAYLHKNIILNESNMTLLIKSFQSSLKTGDAISSEIEAEVRYRIGIALWLAGGKLRKDKNGCIASLLASAKLDTNNSAVYSYIGHYYHIEQKDTARAIKCYLKALNCNPLDKESGISLSQLYISIGEDTKAVKLWNDIKIITSHAYWNLSLYGHYYLFKCDYENSVNLFQLALEIDETDSYSWHGLGVSYASLLQHTAAQKSFLKALSFSPKDIVIKTSLSDVERRLCLLNDSMIRYDDILINKSDDIIALKGCADCSLSLAYQHYTCGWSNGSYIYIMKGVRCIDMIVEILKNSENNGRHTYQCIWKILGDLCSFVRHLSPVDFNTNTDVSSNKNNQNHIHLSGLGKNINCGGEIYNNLLAVINRSQEAYLNILELINVDINETDIYEEICYDLGSSYYHEVSILMLLNGQGSGIISTISIINRSNLQKKLQKSKEYFLLGLKKNPIHSKCWNGLGLTIHSNDEFKQSCFVRSTQIDSNPSSLANLGVLLFSHDRDDSAKECFSSLQLIESNPLTWVGIGNIYERSSTNNNKANLIFARDSYQAALEIAKPVDALFGSAIVWLKLNKYLISSSHGYELKSIQSTNFTSFELSEIRNEVENKLASYIRRIPIQPMAWLILAWSLESRSSYNDSINSCWYGMDALETISNFYLISLENKQNQVDSNENELIKNRIKRNIISLIVSINRCMYLSFTSINFDSSSKVDLINSIEKDIVGRLLNYKNLSTILGSNWNSFINEFTHCTHSVILSSSVSNLRYALNMMKTKTEIEEFINFINKELLISLSRGRDCDVNHTASIVDMIQSLVKKLSIESSSNNLLFIKKLSDILGNMASLVYNLIKNEENNIECENEEIASNKCFISNSKILTVCCDYNDNIPIKIFLLKLGIEWHSNCSLIWIILAEVCIIEHLYVDIDQYVDTAIDIINKVLTSSTRDDDVDIIDDNSIYINGQMRLSNIEVLNTVSDSTLHQLYNRAVIVKLIYIIHNGSSNDEKKYNYMKTLFLKAIRYDPSNRLLFTLYSILLSSISKSGNEDEISRLNLLTLSDIESFELKHKIPSFIVDLINI